MYTGPPLGSRLGQRRGGGGERGGARAGLLSGMFRDLQKCPKQRPNALLRALWFLSYRWYLGYLKGPKMRAYYPRVKSIGPIGSIGSIISGSVLGSWIPRPPNEPLNRALWPIWYTGILKGSWGMLDTEPDKESFTDYCPLQFKGLLFRFHGYTRLDLGAV